MALLMKFQHGEGVWGVGARMKPKEMFGDDGPLELQADGKELDYVNNRFINLPMVENAKVIKWRGDLARFIYDNL